MTHKQILDIFKLVYPIDDIVIDSWYPNGKNSVRVRFTNKVELVFTFKSNREWMIETKESFIKRLEEGLIEKE